MESGESNVLVVDFMSLLRSIPIDQLPRLQDLLNATRKHIRECANSNRLVQLMITVLMICERLGCRNVIQFN